MPIKLALPVWCLSLLPALAAVAAGLPWIMAAMTTECLESWIQWNWSWGIDSLGGLSGDEDLGSSLFSKEKFTYCTLNLTVSEILMIHEVPQNIFLLVLV